MIRLRRFAASAGRVRVRRFAASAGRVRVRRFAASAGRVRVRRFGVAAMTAALIVLGGGTRVLACPMCFGAEESHLIDGAKLGVLVLLGLTLAVQGGFVTFFVYLRRRAKRVADEELDTEWSELQRPSRTS